MPVVGITSNNDAVSGTMLINFSASGFSSKSEQNDNGYEKGVSYLSVKMAASLPNISENNDTYWYTRGALLLSDAFENVWEEPFNGGVFMETITKDYKGQTHYNIVQSDPENPGIPGFVAHYLRMSEGFVSPNTLQYIRFYLGNPQYQGEFVCVAEFDFT